MQQPSMMFVNRLASHGILFAKSFALVSSIMKSNLALGTTQKVQSLGLYICERKWSEGSDSHFKDLTQGVVDEGNKDEPKEPYHR
ncbi:hypothetical protein SAMN05421858_3483 [Haladaptatus litoreus]|uniref:Uncharacterized protein n=1 Tax=Haladaptatus litoreus TaxID=553468 RepID=A0A1N7DB98_9EURY|nr:hypothetical protein SAMN05421858_3483 [Haladaptatus litoreus]